MRPSLFFAFILCSFAACVVDQADLSRYTAAPIENLEEATNIDVTYTDSSVAVFRLKAPVMRRVYNKFSVDEEFPDGIEVTFFDKYERPRSWLTADYARRDQATRLILVEKNVVLRNEAGERLDGPELIWDEKTKEIRTDRFVKITKPDGTLIYSYGFKSNESFTHYELNASSGTMIFDDEEQ